MTISSRIWHNKDSNNDLGRDGGAQAFHAQWSKIDEFIRDFGRDLTKVGDYVQAIGRMTLRGGNIETSGPGVYLEISGAERRIGLLAVEHAVIPLTGGRQRLLLVGWHGGHLVCRYLKSGEGALENLELALDLSPGSYERLRIERAIMEAVDEAGQGHGGGGAWEEAAWRLRLALDILILLARTGRRLAAEAGNRALRGSQLFQRAMDEIHSRFQEDLRLRDIARVVSLSSRHCARLLSQWSGSGFTEHFLMTRLMRARQRMLSSGNPQKPSGVL